MIYRLFFLLLLFITSILNASKAQRKDDKKVDIVEEKEMKLPAPLKNNTLKEIEIPFKVLKGIIYVEAVFNGKKGLFILDSGAPELMLNSDEIDMKSMLPFKSEAKGVGGKVKNSGITHVKLFDWYGIQLKDGDVTAVSMKHLTKKRILGLIGYSVFNDYTLTFDYKKSKIIGVLTPSLSREKAEYGNILAKVPFEMYKHIPILNMDLNGKTYHMGLDTGAASNLFYEKYVPELKEVLTRYKESDLTGIGGKVKAKKGRIKRLKVGDVTYSKLNFIFENNTLDAINKGYKLQLDGLLGYEFLKSHTTIIDFKAKEIRIYE